MTDIVRPSQRFADILTKRESEVLDLVLLGKPNRDTGEELGIAPTTVETVRLRVMRKLNADNYGELMWLGILGQKPPAEWDAEPLPHPELRGSRIDLGHPYGPPDKP
jgi:DNA-binding CsgD family transcriptional regulator